MVPEELDRLSAEERHQVYRMLRWQVYVYPKGDLEMRGVLTEEGLYLLGNAPRHPQRNSSGNDREKTTVGHSEGCI